MILTSNRGFAEWGEVFGDPAVATALLDRPASPRRRHPNRGIELSASPACRPYAGARRKILDTTNLRADAKADLAHPEGVPPLGRTMHGGLVHEIAVCLALIEPEPLTLYTQNPEPLSQ
jgi:hypothetical protein